MSRKISTPTHTNINTNSIITVRSVYTNSMYLPDRTAPAKRCRTICRPFRTLFAVLLALYTISSTLPLASAVSATSCADVTAVFARGSGESLGGTNYTAYQQVLQKTFSTYAPELTLNFYELGTTMRGDYQYPAVSIEDPKILGGTVISLGTDYDFGASVNQGIGELTAYSAQLARTCPNTKLVLAGYSQGAMVLSKALPSLNSDQIAYVATIGDPKLYLPEGISGAAFSTPPACRGKNLSTYRANVPDCKVSAGILKGLNPYQSAGYSGKLGAWCHSGDPMCGSFPAVSTILSGNMLDAHVSYSIDSTYEEISRFILSATKRYYGEKIFNSVPNTTGPQARDTAIVIDTTGSMSALIAQYKTEALKVARQTIDQGGRIALYEYRDELNENFQPRQLCDFSCTYEEFETKLDSLDTEGGGDDPESALSALLQAMNELKWQQGATKSIVLLTDASYHSTDVNGVTLTDVVQRSREIDPVNIYVLTTPYIVDYYTELAEQTGGKIFVNNLGGTNNFTSSTSYLMTRPTAQLLLENYYAFPGEEITYDASGSSAHYEISHYEWDLDFDGIYETTTTEPTVTKTYTTSGTGTIKVKVVDVGGQSSDMTAAVTIFDPEITIPEILSFDVSEGGNEATVNFESSGAELFAISLDDTFIGFTTNHTIILSNVPVNSTLRIVPLSDVHSSGRAVEIPLAHVTPQVPATGAIMQAPSPITTNVDLALTRRH